MRKKLHKDMLESSARGSRFNNNCNRVRDENDLDKRRKSSNRSGRRSVAWHRLAKWFSPHVGRPWDKVYSDFCRCFPTSSFAGREVRNWLEFTVELRPVIINGNLKAICLGDYVDLRPGDLYVHPVDGLLKKVAWRK